MMAKTTRCCSMTWSTHISAAERNDDTPSLNNEPVSPPSNEEDSAAPRSEPVAPCSCAAALHQLRHGGVASAGDGREIIHSCRRRLA